MQNQEEQEEEIALTFVQMVFMQKLNEIVLQYEQSFIFVCFLSRKIEPKERTFETKLIVSETAASFEISLLKHDLHDYLPRH